MRRTLLLFVALLAAVSLPACNSQSASESPSQPVVTSAAKDIAGNWKIELHVMPDHPRMVKPITFIVHIADASGKPIDTAQVNGSLSMKTMDMGKTEVKFASKGNGNYEGSLPSADMSGPWELDVTTTQGNFHALKKFEVVIFD